MTVIIITNTIQWYIVYTCIYNHIHTYITITYYYNMAIDCYRGGWDGKCFITMIPTIFITILVKLLSV